MYICIIKFSSHTRGLCVLLGVYGMFPRIFFFSSLFKKIYGKVRISSRIHTFVLWKIFTRKKKFFFTSLIFHLTSRRAAATRKALWFSAKSSFTKISSTTTYNFYFYEKCFEISHWLLFDVLTLALFNDSHPRERKIFTIIIFCNMQ